jgi:hypothetical protein
MRTRAPTGTKKTRKPRMLHPNLECRISNSVNHCTSKEMRNLDSVNHCTSKTESRFDRAHEIPLSAKPVVKVCLLNMSPLSSSPPANSFVIGPAVINTHTPYPRYTKTQVSPLLRPHFEIQHFQSSVFRLLSTKLQPPGGPRGGPLSRPPAGCALRRVYGQSLRP